MKTTKYYLVHSPCPMSTGGNFFHQLDTRDFSLRLQGFSKRVALWGGLDRHMKTGVVSRKELPLKGGGRPSENPFWYFFVPFHNFLPVWCEDLLVGAFPLASFFVGNALPKMQRLRPERSEVLWTELLLPCERWTYPRLVWWFEVLFVNAGVSGNRAVPHIICSEWWEWRTRNSSYGAILAENCEHLQVSLVEMILKHSQLDGLKQPYLFGMFRCTTADSFEQTSSLCWIHGQSNHWLRCEKKSKDWLRWCERKWSNTLLWHVARVSVVFSLLRHKFRSGNFSMLCMALTGVLWDSCLVFFDNSCLSAWIAQASHCKRWGKRVCWHKVARATVFFQCVSTVIIPLYI